MAAGPSADQSRPAASTQHPESALALHLLHHAPSVGRYAQSLGGTAGKVRRQVPVKVALIFRGKCMGGGGAFVV